VRPVVLAELWHLLFSGSEDHADPVYNMAVMLDTVGETLVTPPRLLAESLAFAGRAPSARSGSSAWPVQTPVIPTGFWSLAALRPTDY